MGCFLLQEVIVDRIEDVEGGFLIMDITIRQAQPTDAEQAAPLIIDAIGDIAKRMTGETEWDKVEQELCVLFKREDNRHSHLYTYIAELDGNSSRNYGVVCRCRCP